GECGETVEVDRKILTRALILGTALEAILIAGDDWVWRGAPAWAQQPGLYVGFELASVSGLHNLTRELGLAVVVAFLIQVSLFSAATYLLMLCFRRIRATDR